MLLIKSKLEVLHVVEHDELNLVVDLSVVEGFEVSLSAHNRKSNLIVQVVLMCFHSAGEIMGSWCDIIILPSPPPENTLLFLSNQASEASRRILIRSLASGIANTSHLPQRSGMLLAIFKPHPDQQRYRIRRGKDLS